jgi:hypothetical protein
VRSRWFAKGAATILAVLAGTSSQAASLFVDARTGRDSDDGLTWSTAKSTCGAALAVAEVTPEPDSISIAEGTYLERLVIRTTVTLQGGFPSGGGSRDPAAHPTRLDASRVGTVVRVVAGADGTVLDGLIVSGGYHSGASSAAGGAGVWTRDANVTVSDCLIEWNEDIGGASAIWGEGASVTILDTLVRDNRALGKAVLVSCNPYLDGLAVIDNTTIGTSGHATVSLVSCAVVPSVIGRHLVISRNTSPRTSPALSVTAPAAEATLEGIVVTDNLSMGIAQPPRSDIRLVNCEVAGNQGAALFSDCQGSVTVEQGTFADNEFIMLDASCDLFWARSSLDAARCVFSGTWWGTTGPDFCPISIGDSIARGLPPLGACEGTLSNVRNVDPVLVERVDGTHALSQVASGDAVDSPGVDQGPMNAAAVGLDAVSTRTDGVGDSGLVDWGFHGGFHVGPTWMATLPVPDDRLMIRRGERPDRTAEHSRTPGLPWTDAPGVLSDPSLPLLFYDVLWTDTPIHLRKDELTDSVVIEL